MVQLGHKSKNTTKRLGQIERMNRNKTLKIKNVYQYKPFWYIAAKDIHLTSTTTADIYTVKYPVCTCT